MKQRKFISGIKSKLGFGVQNDKKKELNDIDFMAGICPKGGIKFNIGNEKYIATGTGYEACIYIYEYPVNIDQSWLIGLTSHTNAITVFDYGTENVSEIKRNLTKSMSEQNSRYNSAKNSGERIEAEERYAELELLYRELDNMSDAMKSMITRIFVTGKTLYDLENNVKKIRTKLEGDGFKSEVCMNETRSDWQSAFLPLKRQSKDIYKKPVFPLTSSQLAFGNPHHYSSLNDHEGNYWGITSTGGTVNLDTFTRTNTRMSYNSIFIGAMRSGKSTSLKKQAEDRAVRGDFVRILDVNGEFTTETEYLGGRVIALDGESKDKINSLQIQRSGDNDAISYNRHVSKISTIYQFMNPTADTQEVVKLRSLLRKLYMDYKIVDTHTGELKEAITKRDPHTYPLWQDLYDKAGDELIDIRKTGGEKSEAERISNIKAIIEDMCDSYGNIFNNYTNIPDVYKEKVVTYNIGGLKDMAGVYEAQFFNALMLNYDNALEVGTKMKKLYEEKKIAWEDVTRFLLIGDEYHRVLSANKLFALELTLLMQREFPKYFAGMSIATQSIRDMVPETATGKAVEEIKKIFELSTYKFLLRQDSNAKKRLREIFDGDLTEWEIEQIPALETGETILSISGQNNLFMQIDLRDDQNDRFKGGA